MSIGDQPAYPVTPPLDNGNGTASGYPFPSDGMTYRQHLIAVALMGFCSNPSIDFSVRYETIAGHAIRQADAVIAMLEKEKRK